MKWKSYLRDWTGDAGSVHLQYWELGWGMMMARLLITVTCLYWIVTLLLLPASLAQYPTQRNADVVIQEALTQQQVTVNSVQLSKLEGSLELERQRVNNLREDLSTVKGIGIGAAAVIGLLQTLQMILQIRAVKKS